ncbi:MAG: tetratricopeptide repeat protein [Elusimicrobiota bacterium]
MMNKTQKRFNKETQPPNINWQELVPVILLSLVLFFAPLFPDVKLTRPKLLLLETGLYGLLFIWLFISFAYGKLRVKVSLLTAPVLAYGAVTALFYFLSPDKIVALNELKRSMLSLSAYFVAANVIRSEKQFLAVAGSWLAGTFLSILYGMLQHSGGIWMVAVPKMDRVMSTSGNPIFFAACIVVLLPIAIGLILYVRKFQAKIFIAAAIFCGIIALYYTETRAALIAFGVSMLAMIFLAVKNAKTRLIMLGALALLGIIIGIATRNIWFRQQEHLLIWRDTLAMWSHYPWTGTGPGTFHIYFPQFASDQLKAVWPQGIFIVNDAHNEYVQYLSETGIIGFGVFLWLIISFFVNAFRIHRNETGPKRFLIAGLIASAAGVLTQNIFSVDMRFIISAVYLFIVMGMLEVFGSRVFSRENLSANIKIAGCVAVLVVSGLVFPKVFQPYIAQSRVAATPDFFDEKVLEAQKTLADLEAMAQKFPDQSLVFEKLGWVYAKEKNWAKAIENMEKAARLDPNSFGPLNNIGNIYFLTGNRPKAIEYWVRSLKIKPDQIDSRLNLATAYYYNGQLKDAVDQLKIVLKIEPGNEKAIVMLKQMTE